MSCIVILQTWYSWTTFPRTSQPLTIHEHWPPTRISMISQYSTGNHKTGCWIIWFSAGNRPAREFLHDTEMSSLLMAGQLDSYVCYQGRPGILHGPSLTVTYFKVISQDPWHLHLLSNVLQWNCRYSRLSSV